ASWWRMHWSRPRSTPTANLSRSNACMQMTWSRQRPTCRADRLNHDLTGHCFSRHDALPRASPTADGGCRPSPLSQRLVRSRRCEMSIESVDEPVAPRAGAAGHPFDLATAVTRNPDGTWRGSTSESYWAFVGPFGGFTAATMLRAILDHPD